MTVLLYLRRFCPAFVVCTILSSPCLAISTTVKPGFDGIVKRGAWTPVSVRMNNQSAESIRGTLIAVQPEYSLRGTPLCAAKVNLPANSKKLYHVYTKPAEYGEALTVRLTADNGAVETKQVRMNIADAQDKVVVSVGDKTSRLSFLAGEKIQLGINPGAGGMPMEASIYPGSVLPDELPDRPAAYESVNMLIVPGGLPASANPKALTAIGMWVASGGTLVVSTGPDYRKCQNGFCDELLPIKISGASNVAGMGSLTALGKTAFSAGPVAVAKSAPKPGIARVLASESGVPLVVERDYGAGKVVFLAFDHLSSPFRDWNGQTEFWKGILRSGGDRPLVGSAVVSDPNQWRYQQYQQYQHGLTTMGHIIMQNPSIKTPSLSTIGLFLIVYIIVLVPINYFVLGRKKRLELAWVTTPAIVIVFTLGAYGIGYTMKGGRLQLREATFIEGSSNARYARVISDASLFSPARRTYRVEVADPYSMCQVLPSSDREALPPAFVSEKPTIDQVPVAMWSSKSFESVSGVDLGGTIKADIILTDDKLQGSIRNDSDASLADCKVIYGDYSYSLGNLPKGAAAKLGAPKTLPSTVQQPVYPGAPQRGSLREQFGEFALSRARAAGCPVLMAKSAAPGGVFRVSDASNESAVFYVFRLGYKAGNAFTIAPGMIKSTIVSYSNGEPHPAVNGLVHAEMYGNGGHIIAAYDLPVQPGTAVKSLELQGTILASAGTPANQKYAVSAYNCKTGNWDALNPSKNADIPNPGRYINSNNQVRIMVKCVSGNSYGTVAVGLSAECGRK